jgi:hypothetical protein
VADCISEYGWAIRFRHIMSRRAEELESLLGRLDSISLNDDEDARTMRFGLDKNFLVKNCYYALILVAFYVQGTRKFGAR